MRDHFEQRDRSRNRQFNRRWTPTLPPSAAEIEHAKLRRELGNIEAARTFRKRIARGQVQL